MPCCSCSVPPLCLHRCCWWSSRVTGTPPSIVAGIAVAGVASHRSIPHSLGARAEQWLKPRLCSGSDPAPTVVGCRQSLVTLPLLLGCARSRVVEGSGFRRWWRNEGGTERKEMGSGSEVRPRYTSAPPFVNFISFSFILLANIKPK